MRLLFTSTLVVLAACSTSPTAATRPVQGHLAHFETGAIVIAEALDSSQTSAAVSATGAFRLALPVNEAVRLSIAMPMSNGAFLRKAQIGPAWFKVGAGSTLDLGEVRVGDASAAATVASTTETVEHQCPARVMRMAEGKDDDGDEKGGHDGRGDGRSDAGVSGRDGRDSDDDAGEAEEGEHRHGDDVECDRVEVEGCSMEHARCDHDRDLEPAEGRPDVCTGADGGASGPGASDAGTPGLG